MSLVAPFGSVISKEHNLPASCTRRRRKTARKHVCLLQSLLVKYGVKQLVELVGLAAFNSRLLVNHAFMQQIHGYFDHGRARTLSVTGLQEPELAFLNGKLHVLHVVVMLLQFILKRIELAEYFRHSLFH